MRARAGRASRRFERMVLLLRSPPSFRTQVPPGCTIMYASSLWKHCNINLDGYAPYTTEVAAADELHEVRWSLLSFSQGSTRRSNINDDLPWTIGRRDYAPGKLPRQTQK